MIKVLVADDERWVRATVINLIPLDELELDLVGEASNGIEALELCKKYNPDILLTDIMMPGLTGLELVKELKHLLPDLKVVIISGYSDFEFAKTAMRFGVQDFLLKPVDEFELKQVLSKLKNDILRERKRTESERKLKAENKRLLKTSVENIFNKSISQNPLSIEVLKDRLIADNISAGFESCELRNCLSPIEIVKAILDENFSSDINLEQIADYVHFSPAHLSELFKKEVGVSFIDYKTQKRIDLAKSLLTSTNFTQTEISTRIGYNDPKYFSKLFRKVTGMTPFEFKESLKGSG